MSLSRLSQKVDQRWWERMDHHPTPFLIMSLRAIREVFQEFRQSFPGFGIHYALKANPEPGIARLLHEMGCGFEISSEGELSFLGRLGVSGEHIISSNTVKTPGFIAAAYRTGIRRFAVDSTAEVEKLAVLAPGSKIYVRLSVSNEGSEWPLERKFGVEMEDALRLLLHAREKGLVPHGVTFHVGSQCVRAESWVAALEKCRTLWDRATRAGVELKLLNLGGGFPVEYTRVVPTVRHMAEVIRDSLERLFPEKPEVDLEPGRALVGEAGVLVTSVIGRAVREGQDWLYLDAGVFHGLMESLGGIRYAFRGERNGPARPWVVAGPSCDGMDVIADGVMLPEPAIGDRVLILSAGAYTVSYASSFNGFPVPPTYLVED